MNTKIRKITVMAMSAALTAVATMIVTIPVPATEGYINVGDAIIFVVSTLWGPWIGAVSGGIGSALADLLLGYTHWAPFTLIIKALEGVLVGIIAHPIYRKEGKKVFRFFVSILAMFVGVVWMNTGYLLGGWVLKGSFAAALTSVPDNLLQGIASMVIAGILLFVVNIGKYIRRNVDE